MAAPSTTVRSTPTGKFIEEGWPCKIAFARMPAVNFWEKSLKPPSADGGEPIDLTTFFNLVAKTKAARTLIDYGPITCKVRYDPAVYASGQIDNLLNKEGSITCYWPDLSKLDFYGYLQKFDPDEMSEGSEATGTITVVLTNWDPVNKVEVLPVMTSVTGT